MSFGKFKEEGDSDKPSTGHTPSPLQGKIEAFLGKGSRVVGTLTFSGPVELDGFVEGEITAQDRLTIGEAAVINAKVTGAEILIRGTVNGDITATKRLSLRKPAKIMGNITCSNLSIEEGVIFEGKSNMGGSKGDTRTTTIKAVGGEKAASA